MAKTVVGLFDDARDAQDVLSDLQGLGFSASDAELITQSALSGDASNVVDRLTNEGVPSSDANLYLEGIRSGGALVVATTSDDQVDQVVDVMNRHNIVDLESRRGTFGTNRRLIPTTPPPALLMLKPPMPAPPLTTPPMSAAVLEWVRAPVVLFQLGIGILRAQLTMIQRPHVRPTTVPAQLAVAKSTLVKR